MPPTAATGRTRELVDSIRTAMDEHLAGLGLSGATGLQSTKEAVRQSHAAQRQETLAREKPALQARWRELMSWFASGSDVNPSTVAPALVQVSSGDETSLVFRLATLLWSVPVSRGYGRRMRYLVVDESNGHLIGVLALGDPVFNLRVRDTHIGWTVDERRDRLVNILDAFVVGAVPPYTQLMGGKLVASLLASREVSSDFDRRYGESVGIISGKAKTARLALVTVTSALGRSSIYNRLRLPGRVELQSVGLTEGWGHFHVPEAVFADMRRLLELEGHPYASGHQYGTGPNWRLRVIRASLIRVGLDPALLRHGIAREVFVMPLAQNWRRYLKAIDDRAVIDRPSARDIGLAARTRWIEPRAARTPEALRWSRDDLAGDFESMFASPEQGSGEQVAATIDATAELSQNPSPNSPTVQGPSPLHAELIPEEPMGPGATGSSLPEVAWIPRIGTSTG
ncbi:MAG: Druantia anti-phage system protein DruA [Chloroflexota bacterium]